MRWLDRIKQKPETERKRIAFSVAGGITAAIFAVWLLGFAVPPGPSPLQQETPATKTYDESGIEDPYNSGIRDSISAFFRRIFSGFHNLLPDTPDFLEKKIQFQRR